MHGYALKRALSPAIPRERLVNDGVLYPLLDRLHRRGWVEKRVEPGAKRPDRHVYAPTPEGEAAFATWLAGPEHEDDGVTYDFLVSSPFLAKSIFFDRLEPAEVREKLVHRRQAEKAQLAELERIGEGMRERGVDPMRVAILELGIAQCRQRIRWLGRRIRACGDRG